MAYNHLFQTHFSEQTGKVRRQRARGLRAQLLHSTLSNSAIGEKTIEEVRGGKIV